MSTFPATALNGARTVADILDDLGDGPELDLRGHAPLHDLIVGEHTDTTTGVTTGVTTGRAAPHAS